MAAGRTPDSTVAEEYLRMTIDQPDDLFAQGQGAEGGHDEPLKWKLYRDVRLLALSDEDNDLSVSLRLAYGMARWEPSPGPGWPFHRTVPSARCLFPTELYVAGAESIPGMNTGVYHYDAAHHILALVRPGNPFARLSEIAGADFTGARWIILLSSLFWKTAFKYRNYAYRLCTQEAGMVAGNVLAASAALGLDAHVHYQFLDRAASRLLGLEAGQESVLAIIPVYPPDVRPSRVLPTGTAEEQDVLATIPPIRVPYHGIGRLDPESCAMITRIDESSFMHDTGLIAGRHPAPDPCRRDAISVIRYPSDDASDTFDMTTAVERRNSGRVIFTPQQQTIPARTVFHIARYSTRSLPDDLCAAGLQRLARLYLVVNDVTDLSPGVYQCCPEHAGMHDVALGDQTNELRAVLRVPNLDVRAANLVAFVACDQEAALRVFGNRAYRILNMSSGLVAELLCLISGTYRLAARVHNGYDAEAARKLLRLPGSRWTPFFQVIIGHDTPGVRYGFPITFPP